MKSGHVSFSCATPTPWSDVVEGSPQVSSHVHASNQRERSLCVLFPDGSERPEELVSFASLYAQSEKRGSSDSILKGAQEAAGTAHLQVCVCGGGGYGQMNTAD